MRFTLHPYTGYETNVGLATTEGAVRHFEQGETESEYSVFVFGGSVAAIFCGSQMGAIDQLVEKLDADGRLGGRKVRSYRFCRAGYKQPQQLALLTYLLARGCRPDLVINIDGLNEVRIGVHNAKVGVQPTWPSVAHWTKTSAGQQPTVVEVDRLLEIRALQQHTRAIADRALAWDLDRSAVLGKLVLSRLTRLQEQWSAAQERYVESAAETASSRWDRPLGVAPTTKNALAESVRCWVESSLMMSQLCGARGIRYLHLVQPTLHDPGSKPLTDVERAKGIGNTGMDETVSKGYRLLRKGSAQLRRRGVDSVDLTRIFFGVQETLYYDRSHFGRRGNEILADSILAKLEPTLVREGQKQVR